MIAIFRANPHAFEGNINLLHRGAVLSIPADDEVASVDAGVARREVRAQTTAWRQGDRPVTPHQATLAAAAPHSTAASAAATEELQGRVQSLEQSLDAMHRELAAENAKLMDLKQLAAAPAAVAAAPAAVAAAPAAVAAAPAAVAAAPAAVAAAPSASPAVAPTMAVGAPRHAELMQSPEHPLPVAAAVPAGVPAPSAVNKAQLGSMAIALVLLLGAGFAYLRKRLARSGAGLPAVPLLDAADTPTAGHLEPTHEPRLEPIHLGTVPPVPRLEQPHPAAAADQGAATAAALTAETLTTTAVAAPAAAPIAATAKADENPHHSTADDPTDYMGVDTEALERSYLDGLNIDALDIDTAKHAAVPYDPLAHDVAAPAAPGHAAEAHAAHPVDATVVAAPVLDYDLLDLDATAQHVNLSGDLYDQPVVTERRTNIVEVLRGAIDRDPNRRDLVLKLLETYYGTATTNQRAFLEVVRNLAPKRDFLTKEDWRKIDLMGRDIAPRDELFADGAKAGRLATFA
jgi:FimV-like protein